MKPLNIVHLQELYHVMAEEAIMGFMAFDLQTRECFFLNKRARELLEIVDVDPSFNLRMEQIFVTKTRGDFMAFNEDLIAHEGLYQDVALRRTNQHTFIANVGVKKIQIENRQVILLMLQDVTLQKKLQRELVAKQIEIKKAYEELLKQNQQLKELDQAKDRFVALTTHELRTPLSAMVSSSEILHLKLYDNEEQMNDFIHMVYDQGQHLLHLVNDILDFAKIQAGKMDFFMEFNDLQPLIQNLVEEFRPMAIAAGLNLVFEACPHPLSCYFDEMRIRQVLANILNNAIKYNRAHGRVHVWCENSDFGVKIFVRDTGQGIPSDHLHKVFDEFETLGQVALHHNGTGLGMPISRRLMMGMGGVLMVESELGKGSTFWVELPKTKVLGEELYRPRPTSRGGMKGSTGGLAVA